MASSLKDLYLIWMPGKDNAKLYLSPRGKDYVLISTALRAAAFYLPIANAINADLLGGRGTLEKIDTSTCVIKKVSKSVFDAAHV